MIENGRGWLTDANADGIADGWLTANVAMTGQRLSVINETNGLQTRKLWNWVSPATSSGNLQYTKTTNQAANSPRGWAVGDRLFAAVRVKTQNCHYSVTAGVSIFAFTLTNSTGNRVAGLFNATTDIEDGILMWGWTAQSTDNRQQLILGAAATGTLTTDALVPAIWNLTRMGVALY